MTDVARLLENPVEATDIVKKFGLLLVKYAMKKKKKKEKKRKRDLFFLKKYGKKYGEKTLIERNPQLPVAYARTRGNPLRVTSFPVKTPEKRAGNPPPLPVAHARTRGNPFGVTSFPVALSIMRNGTTTIVVAISHTEVSVLAGSLSL